MLKKCVLERIMIPKIIHYCWFGGNPLTEMAHRCIASWKKYFPKYEIRRWSESNYDIHKIPYIDEAYTAKKYAFVSDYARFDILYWYGGICFDTDVEVIKPFMDDMLENNVCFCGFEDNQHVNPGSIFAGEKGCRIAKELMEFYAAYNFMKENSTLNLTPSPVILTNLLLGYGLIQDGSFQKLNNGTITIYPTEYFCPKSFKTGVIKQTHNTYCIHHFSGSWLDATEQYILDRRIKIISVMGNNLISKIIIRIFNAVTRIKGKGLINTWHYYRSLK
jgi:mannosyltransferase OCH1-like enzyme